MQEPVPSSNVSLANPFDPITMNASQLQPSNPHMFLENDYTSAPCAFPQQSTSYQSTNFVPSLVNSNVMPPIGPLPPSKSDHQMSGMYSSSGFDMLSILSKLANRWESKIIRYTRSSYPKLLIKVVFYYSSFILCGADRTRKSISDLLIFRAVL